MSNSPDKSDPVSISNTSEISGDLVEFDEFRVIESKNSSGEHIGSLFWCEPGCWMYSEADGLLNLNSWL